MVAIVLDSFTRPRSTTDGHTDDDVRQEPSGSEPGLRVFLCASTTVERHARMDLSLGAGTTYERFSFLHTMEEWHFPTNGVGPGRFTIRYRACGHKMGFKVAMQPGMGTLGRLKSGGLFG